MDKLDKSYQLDFTQDVVCKQAFSTISFAQILLGHPVGCRRALSFRDLLTPLTEFEEGMKAKERNESTMMTMTAAEKTVLPV